MLTSKFRVQLLRTVYINDFINNFSNTRSDRCVLSCLSVPFLLLPYLNNHASLTRGTSRKEKKLHLFHDTKALRNKVNNASFCLTQKGYTILHLKPKSPFCLTQTQELKGVMDWIEARDD
jgi:hypothetical protein